MGRLGPSLLVSGLLASGAGAVGGCGPAEPPLPSPGADESPGLPVPPVSAPDTPGQSTEFQEMETPPGQLTRARPIGEAWPMNDGPTYRSLCLRCHSVSQTSFAVADWLESAHARAGILCSSCHGAHETSFIPQPGVDRCAVCHAPQVEEFLASAHGPERAPGMRCVSCHEIHATDRRIVDAVALCSNCHLDSEHVQGFGESRMGTVLAEHPPDTSGANRAADCVLCHMPASPILLETGEFRNDRLTLHDPSITVKRHPRDDRRLDDSAIEFLTPVCLQCHSERNARHRLENSDALIRRWIPLGMAEEVRRRPGPVGRGPAGSVPPGGAP